MNTEAVLQQASSAGKNLVRGGSGNNDEIDILRPPSRRFDSQTGRFFSEVTGRLALFGDMALFDTSTLTNPLIGGLDHLLQIVVGENFFRQITTRTCNF